MSTRIRRFRLIPSHDNALRVVFAGSVRIQAAHPAIGHALVCTLAAARGLSGDESVRFMLPEHIAAKKMGIK